ncbi:hypothetical protein FGO68_gene1405 [Halteria grandinella]|uniref:Uncharacterized protein n=1 Tax=Halteria grandinella TaxID=5974 RepID=A0A8J8P2P5_HALGN|nr:hypothetical protein FGO68_gene1405 [Halteria grandinella]
MSEKYINSLNPPSSGSNPNNQFSDFTSLANKGRENSTHSSQKFHPQVTSPNQLQLPAGSEARGGRKGTATSCELALIECPSQSEKSSNGPRSSEIRRSVIASIREDLMEYTEPAIYKEKMEKLQKEAEIDSLVEDALLDDEQMDMLLLGDDIAITPQNIVKQNLGFSGNNNQLDKRVTSMKQVHIFPRPLQAETKHESPSTMNRRNKFQSQKAVSAEDQRVDMDNSGRQKVGDLRIHIEKDSQSPNTPFQLNTSTDTNNNVLVQSNSCDKQVTQQQNFFQGITPVMHNQSNSPDRQHLRHEVPQPTTLHNEYMKSFFYPNNTQQNNNSSQYVDKSDTISQTQYQYEATSPMSSNIGSYYYDRLEEFLPEKKVVAEKKLIRMASKYFYEDENGKTAVSNSRVNIPLKQIEEKVSPQVSTTTPRYRGGWQQNSRGGYGGGVSTGSIQKSQYGYGRFSPRKRKANQQEPSLLQKKAILRERLTKFKDQQAETKEKQRLETAQSLKFLRKLGRKLRNPVFKKVPINRFGSGVYNNLGTQNSISPKRIAPATSPYHKDSRKASDSPPKSMISQDDARSSKKISPRIQLMQHQKMLNLQKQNSINVGGENNNNSVPRNGGQFCFHLTVAQDDNESANFRKSKASSSLNGSTPSQSHNHSELPHFQKKDDNSVADEYTGELLANVPLMKGKQTSSDLGLPKFRDSEAFSFDVRENFQVDSNGLLVVANENPRQPSSFFRQAHGSGNNLLRPQGSFNSGNGGGGVNFSDVNRQFSFAPEMLLSAYQEIAQLSSPVMHRNQVQPELDEAEEIIIDALQEYRQVETYKEFKNYRSYYEDALQQNMALTLERKLSSQRRGSSRHLLIRQPSIKVSNTNLLLQVAQQPSITHQQQEQPQLQPSSSNITVDKIHPAPPSQGQAHPQPQPQQFNLAAFMGDEMIRDRFQAVSFKDSRYFINPSNSLGAESGNSQSNKWQEQVNSIQMMDQKNSVIEEERKGETLETEGDQSNHQIRVIDTSQTFDDNMPENLNDCMERQVSNQDLNPLIDQSQPAPLTREPSLHKSEKKSSNISHRKVKNNLMKLANMLHANEIPSQRTRQPVHGYDQSQEYEGRYKDEQRGTQPCFSGERGDRESSGSNNGKLRPTNYQEGKPAARRSKIFSGHDSPKSKEGGLFSDKQALKRLSKNLKNLYQDIEQRSPSPEHQRHNNQQNLENTMKLLSGTSPRFSPQRQQQVSEILSSQSKRKEGDRNSIANDQRLRQLGGSLRDLVGATTNKMQTQMKLTLQPISVVPPLRQPVMPILNFAQTTMTTDSAMPPSASSKKGARQQPKQKHQEQNPAARTFGSSSYPQQVFDPRENKGSLFQMHSTLASHNAQNRR